MKMTALSCRVFLCLWVCLLAQVMCVEQVHAQAMQLSFENGVIPSALNLGNQTHRWKVSDTALGNPDVDGNDSFTFNLEPTDKLSLSADVSIIATHPKGGFWGLAVILKDKTRVQVFNQNKTLRYYVTKAGEKLKPQTFDKLAYSELQRATFHVNIDGDTLQASAGDGKTHTLTLPSTGITRVEFQAYHMQVSIHSLSADGAATFTPKSQADDEHLKSQLDVPDDAVQRPSDPNALVIFYIGDSITRHGTSAAIKKKLGWDHLAGMAATEESKDFAHLFAAHVQAKNPQKKVSLFFHSKGGAGAAAPRLAALGSYVPLKPDIIVVQLGEHEKEHVGEQALRTSYRALLSTMQSWEHKPIILCVGVWNPYGKGERTAYTQWTHTVDQVMSDVCKELAIPYASMEKHALNPANSGWGTTGGVQWHPNDAGMQAYANELIRMYDATPKK